MINVVPLKGKFVLPAHVLESLEKELPNLREIYVVGFDNEGTPIIWASGDLKTLCHASMVLQDTAFKYVRGEVDDG